MKTRIALVIVALLAAAPVFAQQPAPIATTNGGPTLSAGPSVTQTPDDSKAVVRSDAAPVALTDSQKMQLMLVAKEVQLQQQAAQLAMNAAEKAQAQLQQLIAAMTPAGFVLNEKLELVPAPKPEAKTPGK